MFRGFNLTKHCDAQNNQLFTALKLTKHCNAQKNSKIFKASQRFVSSEVGNFGEVFVWKASKLEVFAWPAQSWKTNASLSWHVPCAKSRESAKTPKKKQMRNATHAHTHTHTGKHRNTRCEMESLACFCTVQPTGWRTFC